MLLQGKTAVIPGAASVRGIGFATARLFAAHGARVAIQIALPDAFLDAGALPTLHDRYGISTAAMAASIKGWLSR